MGVVIHYLEVLPIRILRWVEESLQEEREREIESLRYYLLTYVECPSEGMGPMSYTVKLNSKGNVSDGVEGVSACEVLDVKGFPLGNGLETRGSVLQESWKHLVLELIQGKHVTSSLPAYFPLRAIDVEDSMSQEVYKDFLEVVSLLVIVEILTEDVFEILAVDRPHDSRPIED